jgi:hypothetical protein
MKRILLVLAIAVLVMSLAASAFGSTFIKGKSYFLNWTGQIVGVDDAGAILINVYDWDTTTSTVGSQLANRLPTWCVDPDISLLYHSVSVYTDILVDSKVKYLIDNHPATANADMNAGLSLAIWQLIDGPILGDGTDVRLGYSTGAQIYRQQFYNEAIATGLTGQSYVAGFEGFFNGHQANQNLIPSVPEPVSIMLGALGLGVVTGLKKLRRK